MLFLKINNDRDFSDHSPFSVESAEIPRPLSLGLELVSPGAAAARAVAVLPVRAVGDGLLLFLKRKMKRASIFEISINCIVKAVL